MLKKITILLSALSMMMVMAVPPVMAEPGGDVCDVVCPGKSRGNKADDGLDPNKGGGQEHIRNGHPPHGGGVCHAGGCGNGGGND